jgi:hypothetical protein
MPKRLTRGWFERRRQDRSEMLQEVRLYVQGVQVQRRSQDSACAWKCLKSLVTESEPLELSENHSDWNPGLYSLLPPALVVGNGDQPS